MPQPTNNHPDDGEVDDRYRPDVHFAPQRVLEAEPVATGPVELSVTRLGHATRNEMANVHSRLVDSTKAE